MSTTSHGIALGGGARIGFAPACAALTFELGATLVVAPAREFDATTAAACRNASRGCNRCCLGLGSELAARRPSASGASGASGGGRERGIRDPFRKKPRVLLLLVDLA